jgi:hypothetical protein
MARPSHIPPLRSKVVNKLAERWKKGFLRRSKTTHIGIVEGFFSKYFEGKDWTERTKEIYRAVQDRHVDGRWTDFPNPPVQNAVLEWLFRFQEEFLTDAQGVYYTSESSKDLTGAEARRQLDVFVKPSGENISKTVHER